MNINEVKHDKCDRSSDTSLYLQSGINVLRACHFTCSSKTQQEQNFRKSLIISYRDKCTATKFSRNTLLSYIVVSQKLKLKLITAKFLFPMISRNELSMIILTATYMLYIAHCSIKVNTYVLGFNVHSCSCSP